MSSEMAPTLEHLFERSRTSSLQTLAAWISNAHAGIDFARTGEGVGFVARFVTPSVGDPV